MNINKIIVSGRLVKDPEAKTVGEHNLCSMRIVSNRIQGKNKNEKSMFIDVNCWGNQSGPCLQFLKKGSRVIVEGSLYQDDWTDKNGNNRTTYYIDSNNIMFLDSKNTEDTSSKSNQETEYKQVSREENVKEDTYDEDLPF